MGAGASAVNEGVEAARADSSVKVNDLKLTFDVTVSFFFHYLLHLKEKNYLNYIFHLAAYTFRK